jgi:hypothetical protein
VVTNVSEELVASIFRFQEVPVSCSWALEMGATNSSEALVRMVLVTSYSRRLDSLSAPMSQISHNFVYFQLC